MTEFILFTNSILIHSFTLFNVVPPRFFFGQIAFIDLKLQ